MPETDADEYAFRVVCAMVDKYGGGGYGESKLFEISRHNDRILVNPKRGLPLSFFTDMSESGYEHKGKCEMLASNKRKIKRSDAVFVPWIVFERKC